MTNHILKSEQFTPQQLADFFKKADLFRIQDSSIKSRQEQTKTHNGRIILSMFYEPSTRTRFGFEIAAKKLGISVIGTENATEFSSAAKGESIEDTVRVFNEYGIDAIVLRTKEEGHALRASLVSKVPIINGGDGKAEHPTQAILDIYTIQNEIGRLSDLRIVIGGDLAHGRTARSLAILLAKYPNNQIVFVSAPGLGIGNDVKELLLESGTKFTETEEMYDAFAGADVVYWTRLQLERLDNLEKTSTQQNKFVIDEKALGVLPGNAIIMHPLPRLGEIPASTDSDPRAKYFKQAGNGLYVRMAILDNLLSNLS